jgi:predicted SprT family Zn-dependent metalloprotease
MTMSAPIHVSARTVQAEELARKLLNSFGLPDWSFRFNKSKVHLGLCLYGLKAIELSRHFVERNGFEMVADTLLHEIAHALVGPGHGHDAAWKETCIRVGAKPERLSYEADMPEGCWQATCGCCGMLHHKHRKPKHMVGWWCARCGPVQGRLVWQQKPDPSRRRGYEGRATMVSP